MFANIFYDSILLQLLKHASLFEIRWIGEDGGVIRFYYVF